MYYIGLDVHKKTISYCVKDASGRMHQEGKVGSTRRELDCWMKTLPQPWTWPWRRRSSAAGSTTICCRMPSDQGGSPVDAACDCRGQEEERPDRCRQDRRLPALRFPAGVPHDAAEIRDRRRTLRYRHLLVRQMVQMKNRVSGLLMETGVEYNKQRLHKVSYFRELLSTNAEIHPSIRPLLKLSRETIERCQKTEYALVSSLQRDPLLADRIKRLRTVPGVGPITALTWALEIGDVSRFRTIKQAISYCGLCGDERSSADKVMRMPLSKQRNKHIQRALVEAAKLAPRQSHELAVIYEREKQKGNGNRATLAVARKMVAYLLAVDRQQTRLYPC